MDWARQRWTMTEADLNTFEYETRQSKVISLKGDDEENRATESVDLTSEEQWLTWLENDQKSPPESTTLVVLSGRMPDDDDDFENPMVLSYLPYTRAIFKRILDQLFFHESVARVINRNYAATFCRSYLTVENPARTAIVYTCRSSAHWADDMALSVTHFPDTCSTHGMFFGCSVKATDRTAMDRISNRLTLRSEDAFIHPMFLIGIFAEIERQRMMDLVRRERHGLMHSIAALQQMGYGVIGNSESSVSPWLTNYEIKNGLEHWANLLVKMIAHIKELEQRYYVGSTIQETDAKGHPVSKSQVDRNTEAERIKEKLRQSGNRIKDRLAEILLDYQEMIRDYTMITDGLTLATNLVLARDNLRLSNETIETSRRALSDGKQMKSIAVLTMVFLPATFVAVSNFLYISD
ncbi:hypothetical protein BJ170DRAFT_677948 [Xylariales sp. AK1849]|nr:hypothetical protein BJ170DRAFT_677948 [Xylariales sp. AK1849]